MLLTTRRSFAGRTSRSHQLRVDDRVFRGVHASADADPIVVGLRRRASLYGLRGSESVFQRFIAVLGLCALLTGVGAPRIALADGGPSNSASSPAEQARAAQKLQSIGLRDDPTYDYAQVTMSLWQE